MTGTTDLFIPTSGPEGELIQRAKRMEENAWREIYNQHYKSIYAYLYYRTEDANLAEDLTAEVFARAIKGIRGFTYQGTKLSTWLREIAMHLLIDQYRSRGAALPPVELDERLPGIHDDPQQQTESSEAIRELYAAIAQLTEEQQQVILMRFMGEMSTAEVADQLKKSETAIKALQRRALSTLRNLWHKG